MKPYILEKLKATYLVFKIKKIDFRTSGVVKSEYEDSGWKIVSQSLSKILKGKNRATIWNLLLHKSIEPNTSFAMAGNYVQTTSEEYLKYKSEKLKSIMSQFKNFEILELGCGFGWNLAVLREAGHMGKLTGADISQQGIYVARKISEKFSLNIQYVLVDLTDRRSLSDLTQKHASADLIFTYQVFEQLPYNTNNLVGSLIREFKKKKFIFIESSASLFPLSFSDLLSKYYVKKKCYQTDVHAVLKNYQKQGLIVNLQVERLRCGHKIGNESAIFSFDSI